MINGGNAGMVLALGMLDERGAVIRAVLPAQCLICSPIELDTDGRVAGVRISAALT